MHRAGVLAIRGHDAASFEAAGVTRKQVRDLRAAVDVTITAIGDFAPCSCSSPNDSGCALGSAAAKRSSIGALIDAPNLIMTSARERRAEAFFGGSEAGLQPNGLLKLMNRFVPLTGAVEGKAKIVMRLGVLG